MEESPAPTPPSQEIHPEVLALFKLVTNKLTKENRSVTYANNTRFESSVWDFKIFFGQLQQDVNSIDWHTVVTMPWLQAKLLLYFVRLNVAFHERDNGQMRVPEVLRPKRPTAPTEEQAKSDPSWMELFEIHRAIYEETFGRD
jgi:hypothetical protein